MGQSLEWVLSGSWLLFKNGTKAYAGDGERDQWLRGLAALSGVLGSVPSTHM